MRVILFMIFCFLLSASSYGLKGFKSDKCDVSEGPWEYMITLVDERFSDRLFCLPIAKTNINAIAQLEERIDSNTGIGVPLGPIKSGRVSSGHDWSFHIDPEKIEFVDLAIEVCDGTFKYVEENLSEWIEKVKNYCPWGASDWVVDIEHSKL